MKKKQTRNVIIKYKFPYIQMINMILLANALSVIGLFIFLGTILPFVD